MHAEYICINWQNQLLTCILELQNFRNTERVTIGHHKLSSMFVMNYFPSFDFNLLIQPLSITAALSTTLGRPAGRTGIEAAQAVFIEAVTEVHSAENQEALAIVDLTLCRDHLSVIQTQGKSYTSCIFHF